VATTIENTKRQEIHKKMMPGIICNDIEDFNGSSWFNRSKTCLQEHWNKKD